MASLALAACVALMLASCSARYATGPDGPPVGAPDVTYDGPGAGIGGVQVDAPAPPPAAPPPASLTAPPAS